MVHEPRPCPFRMFGAPARWNMTLHIKHTPGSHDNSRFTRWRFHHPLRFMYHLLLQARPPSNHIDSQPTGPPGARPRPAGGCQWPHWQAPSETQESLAARRPASTAAALGGGRPVGQPHSLSQRVGRRRGAPASGCRVSRPFPSRVKFCHSSQLGIGSLQAQAAAHPPAAVHGTSR